MKKHAYRGSQGINNYNIKSILEVCYAYTIDTGKIFIHSFTLYNEIGLGSEPHHSLLVTLSQCL